MTPAQQVRDARPEDAEALHALYHAAYAVHEDPHRPPQAALKDSVADVRAYIAEGLVLVVEGEDGRLLGSIMLRRVANMRRLAVAPEAKGKGLGGALLEAAVARAREEGMTLAMLDTFPEHPWLAAFYRRHGFRDRCVEVFPDGARWLQLRRGLREPA
jgi:GNAT superfamily N-acetyltransferase